MNKKWTIAIVITLLLLVGVVWAGGFLEEDSRIAELERLRDEGLEHRDSMSDEQRRDHRNQFRDKVRELPDDQRRQFFKNSRGQFQEYAMQRMNEFFAKSPDEQRESLDHRIDRMEDRSAQREQRGGEARGGDRPSMTPQDRDQRRKQGLDRSTPEMRSMRDAFRDMLNNRRQERGLEPIHGRPGRGPY